MSATATMVSPSFPFPGPPPPPSPYSHTPVGSTSNPAPPSGLISPPESRRTSGDEAPSSAPTTRQSLPSISEALGGPDPTLPYPPHAPPPPQTGATSGYFPTAASTSVADLHRRSVTSGPPPPEPPHSYPPSQSQSPYMNRGPPVQAPHTPTAQGDPYSRPPYPAQPPKLPTLQPIKTDTSPTASFRPPLPHAPQHPSPAYDTPPHSAPSQAPYPYTGYQPQGYQYSHPPLASAAPHYPPAGAPVPPREYGGPGRWENGVLDERARAGLPVAFHGESVKRHLDDFDLEASLNEIAECSGKMLEFTREYGVHTHGTQRTGLNPRSIPHLQTVEELMQKSRRIEDSLKRVREMVIAQNHALEQEMKDSGRSGPGSYSDMNGYPDDKQGMGGFAGGDTKKRRGRAAPPGRCHSCNRAETPEWRRGPDGARTLCNACGLHYAKLTRKMGNKGQQIASSNLRPKSEA